MRVGEKVGSEGGELYIVGGWVRDRIMGRDSAEVDLATNLPAARLRRALRGLGSVFDIGEKFGTIGLRADDTLLEITTFRSDEYTPGSRHPEVTAVANIEADLSRRDFTINAMALSVAPEPGVLADPFDGRLDIERRLVRTPGEPAPRMAEDPLRMMRAVRFSAQLGFEIDTVLLEVLRSGAAMLEDISWERRREELEKILVSESPASGLRTLVKTGLMEHVSPEIAAMEGVEQPPSYHRADVLEHTLLTVGCVSPDPLLRRAALFHDAGKPPARVTEPKTMFPDHDRIGVELTTQAMRRLRYGNEDIRKTVFIVRMHMRPIHYRSDWSDAAVRRLVRDCTLMKDCEVAVPLEVVLAVARADILAGNEEKATVFLGLVDELEGRIEALRAEQAIESIRSPLDGRELMAIFDLGPGPWIEDVKEHLVQLMLEGELSPDDKEKAANRARIFLNEITSPL